MTLNEYRAKHKRCGTCVYWRGSPLVRLWISTSDLVESIEVLLGFVRS